MSDLRRLGAEAEDRAANFLLGLGYTLVTRRFKARRGELDIVALDGDVLVFVEVKFRRSANANPEAGITNDKVQAFHEAALEYLAKSDFTDPEIRFDVIAIGPERLEHHIDAFHR